MRGTLVRGLACSNGSVRGASRSPRACLCLSLVSVVFSFLSFLSFLLTSVCPSACRLVSSFPRSPLAVLQAKKKIVDEEFEALVKRKHAEVEAEHKAKEERGEL